MQGVWRRFWSFGVDLVWIEGAQVIATARRAWRRTRPSGRRRRPACRPAPAPAPGPRLLWAPRNLSILRHIEWDLQRVDGRAPWTLLRRLLLKWWLLPPRQRLLLLGLLSLTLCLAEVSRMDRVVLQLSRLRARASSLG